MDTKKQHLEIKNRLNAEIQAWVKRVLSIKDKDGQTFEDWCEGRDMSTPTRKGEVIHGYLEWLRRFDLVPEELEQRTFTFPDWKEYVVQLSVVVENPDSFIRKFGNGTHPKVATSPSTNHYNMRYRCKNMQDGVVAARELMQTNPEEIWDDGKREDVISKQKKMKRDYKKAHPSDPIRRCWKWITNSRNIEGVHIPLSEPPTLKAELVPWADEKMVNAFKKLGTVFQPTEKECPIYRDKFGRNRPKPQNPNPTPQLISPVQNQLIASFVI